jgi:hypothetical protein
MNRFLMTTALVAAFGAAPARAATLGIEVFDNGTLIDNITGVTTGAASLSTNDAAFSNITVNAQGSPILPKADLSSVTLDATSATGFSGPHTLTIDILQGAVAGTGNTLSTFTVNGLVNDPGPTTESTFADAALLASHTFPVGLLDGSFGPVSAATGAFTSDEVQFNIAFTAADQSFGGSAQLTTGVPEPSTWAMLAIGFGFLGFTAYRRGKVGRLAV